MLDDTLMDNGNTFQSAGAATEKARSPLTLHHLLSNGCSAVNGCRQNESPNS